MKNNGINDKYNYEYEILGRLSIITELFDKSTHNIIQHVSDKLQDKIIMEDNLSYRDTKFILTKLKSVKKDYEYCLELLNELILKLEGDNK